jgi:hypothetical protein
MPDIAELPASRRERNDLSATDAYRIDPWPVIRDKPVREAKVPRRFYLPLVEPTFCSVVKA